MKAVAREGADRLVAILNPYRAGCGFARGAITLSEALASGVNQFSADYEATIATIRTQALGALHEAKGFLEHLEPELKKRLGDDVLR